MKLTSSIRQLQDAIGKVAQAIPAKAIDARFENVHLTLEAGCLTLFATDGELSITAQVTFPLPQKVTLKHLMPEILVSRQRPCRIFSEACTIPL
jgi:DNA polymerase III sliding clamp (beta) subunit (PCNA family)